MAALAFHQSLARPAAGPPLALACLAGWALAHEHRSRAPIWDGLELAALALWGYTQAGYALDFSQISVASAYAALGQGWHPYSMIAVVGLRQLCALGAPVIPVLIGFSFADILPAFPLFGAISAGNLANLWVDRFWSGKGLVNISSDEFIARAFWAALLCWAILLWRVVTWAWDRRIAWPRREQAPGLPSQNVIIPS